MARELREFQTEGQRLLCESPYGTSEIAKLVGVRRQRVDDWKSARCRPGTAEREKLKKMGVPMRTWEAPPMVREPTLAPPAPAPTPKPTMTPTAAAVLADVESLDLVSLGLEGLERLVARIHKIEATLPVRERVSAMQLEGRLLQVHEGLRLKAANAREEWLRSPEFISEVRLLVASVPGSASTLRERLASLGVALPDPTTPESTPERAPFESVDALLAELERAKIIADAGEPALAKAHVFALELERHADRIASLLLDDAPRAGRLLSLLEGGEERVIRLALERALAVRDVAALAPEARRPVAELLGTLGHMDLAAMIGGVQ